MAESEADRANERRIAYDTHIEEARRVFHIDLVVYFNNWRDWCADAIKNLSLGEPPRDAAEPVPPGGGFAQMAAMLTIFAPEQLLTAVHTAMDAVHRFQAAEVKYRGLVQAGAPRGDDVVELAAVAVHDSHAQVDRTASAVGAVIHDLLTSPP